MMLDDIASEDNAWHYRTGPNYIEWWYLDTVFVSGYQLAGSFGIWGNLRRPSTCVIRSDFLLATPTGSVVDFGDRVQMAAFHASTHRCEVYLGESYLRDDGAYYLLHLQSQDDVSLDLVVTPECPGFGYRHFFDVDKDQHFSWIVPVPRAAVRGILHFADGHIPLHGVGYHDHNWGSVSLDRRLRGWKWGRFHGDDVALVFAVVEGNQRTLFRGLALIEREDQVFGYQYLSFGTPTPDIAIEDTPLGWNMMIVDTDVIVRMRLEKTRPMPVSKGSAGYDRLLSRVSGRVQRENQERDISGLMLHEFKQLK